MNAAIIASLAVLSVSIILLLIRFIAGPTLFDKVLSANVIGTNIILVILFMAELGGGNSYIDIALVYAFLNFVATIAFLRFFSYKS